MDTQEQIWRGESGKGFYLTSRSTYSFSNICGFSKGQSCFDGQTFLRFPLRTKASKLFNEVYTIDKLRKLLKPLKEE